MSMKIEWTKLSTNGLNGNLAKGVSAAYVAYINNKLIVAGGANFPDKLGFEGGSKALYDEVLLFDEVGNVWKEIGKLPDAAAYGASVPLSDGALWIGGNTSSKSLSSVYRIRLTGDNTLDICSFPDLPKSMDNFAGCSLNGLVFVANDSSFYFIDTNTDNIWKELPMYPGIARSQAVMTVMEQDANIFIYLLGGFFGGSNDKVPVMANKIMRFSFTENKWEEIGELIDSDTNHFFSLTGATVMPIDNRHILCLGGVNYNVFLGAITDLYEISVDSTISSEERKRKNIDFLRDYMTQDIEYYKFNKECRLYDTETNVWTTIDVTPNAARAGASIVYDGKTAYVVQGELKPGHRSPITWKLKV